jgi:hypothetical protein
MPFSHWLYDEPLIVVASFIVLPIVALSITATLLLRRVIPESWAESKDSIGLCASAVGVIYAVLLGMIAVAAWGDYTSLSDKVTEEASIANNLFRDAEGFPVATRNNLQRLYRDYVGKVYCDEWPKLRTGDDKLATNPDTRLTVGELMDLIAKFKPQDAGEINVHRESLQVFNHLLSMRRARLLATDAQLLPVLWIVVLAGGFITIGLTWLVHVAHKWLNVLLNGTYALVVSLMIFCIFSLDHPFRGEISVDPGPFEYVAKSMDEFYREKKRDITLKDCLSQQGNAGNH